MSVVNPGKAAPHKKVGDGQNAIIRTGHSDGGGDFERFYNLAILLGIYDTLDEMKTYIDAQKAAIAAAGDFAAFKTASGNLTAPGMYLDVEEGL